VRAVKEVPMYSSIWMFAWDLRNEGADRVLGFASGLGLKAINIATSYHAGMFILPHNPKGKVYFPEDGVVYFHPETNLYKDTPVITPPAFIRRLLGCLRSQRL
jgi:hypothetical protein